jgi:hypothetical protein
VWADGVLGRIRSEQRLDGKRRSRLAPTRGLQQRRGERRAVGRHDRVLTEDRGESGVRFVVVGLDARDRAAAVDRTCALVSGTEHASLRALRHAGAFLRERSVERLVGVRRRRNVRRGDHGEVRR